MRISKGMQVLEVPWRYDYPIRRGTVIDSRRPRFVVVDFGNPAPEAIDRSRVVPDSPEGLAYASSHQAWLRVLYEEEEARRKAVEPVMVRFAPLVNHASDKVKEARRALEAKHK